MYQSKVVTNNSYAQVLIFLFAITIFLSAYLLFQIQPLISKFILPWFGGSPSVWTAAMLFFQCTLFGGYVYAHILTRHGSPKTQFLIHIFLLVFAAALAIVIMPDASLKPWGEEDPVWKILVILGTSVGLPYFCLATTGPLIQYWFTQIQDDKHAYRLYALSNLGSFLALLTFPYFFEPRFSLSQIGEFWKWGFWLFAVLCGAVAYQVWSIRNRNKILAESDFEFATSDDVEKSSIIHPSVWQRVSWIFLPFLASLTFIATTDHVSHDVAPEPRLWIATLSLYLLTFIICFDHPRWYRRKWVALTCILAIVMLSGRNEIPGLLGFDFNESMTSLRWSHLLTMFLICFVSHGELVRVRPVSPRYLTEFYLYMSFGGACGGLFVSLIATNVFNNYYEWTVCLIAALIICSWIWVQEINLRGVKKLSIAVSVSLAVSSLVFFWEDPFDRRYKQDENSILVHHHQSRNFYGTATIIERQYPHDPSKNYRKFLSGQVLHGGQYVSPDKRRIPVEYYTQQSGLGETIDYAMHRQPSLSVAIIGLGAGTTANYARATDQYDFYEINPDAISLSKKWFDNLEKCKAQTKRIFVGDARLKLEQLPDNQKYDIITLDAFTGDSVPMHLLTKEAFAIYKQHLKPNGFIVIHITNRYLNLYPVVKNQAEALKLNYRNKFQEADEEKYMRRSHFFIISEDQKYFKKFSSSNEKIYDTKGNMVGEVDPNIADVPIWTDQFSSLDPIAITKK